jgi:hypothetical protein
MDVEFIETLCARHFCMVARAKNSHVAMACRLVECFAGRLERAEGRGQEFERNQVGYDPLIRAANDPCYRAAIPTYMKVHRRP